MTSKRLAVFLSSLGFVIPACTGPSESSAPQASSLRTAVDVDAYFASPLFTGLRPEVGLRVRRAVLAAPGTASQRAMVELFSSANFVKLGTLDDFCRTGARRQEEIAHWTLAVAGVQVSEDAARADQRAFEQVTEFNARLSSYADLSGLDDIVYAISTSLTCAGVHVSCPTPYLPATCWATQTSTNTELSDNADGASSDRVLADMFAQVERVQPSAGLLKEWDVLRARYGAASARATPALSDRLRRGRHQGSRTLAHDARAAQRFDRAAELVDGFLRRGIAFSDPAMSLVHSLVSDTQPGRLRRAGEEVRAGRRSDRSYLAGAHVEGAVSQLFHDVRRSRLADMPTPHLAATFNQRMLSIHPFRDANGRTTRLMTDWLLTRAGYPPIVPSTPGLSYALHWQTTEVEAQAHLEHVTEGMRATVRLLEAAVG